MQNVLITGVEGFIGSAISRQLATDLSESFNIVGLAFDRHQSGSATCNHMVFGDIRDRDLMRRIIGDYEINVVYHMAAQSIVRVCANDPVSAYDINVMGTVSVLDACRIAGKNTVKSVIVSTSDKAYGHAPCPYTEDTPLDPKFTYEASKTCQDIVARSYFHNYGVPVKVARCSNVYGPGDRNLSRLIPRSISLIHDGEAPVLYDGVDEYVREFVYIDDVIDAFRTIVDLGANGEAYCVGGTGEYKILDMINIIISIMGSDVTPKIENKSSNFKEISAQWIDSSKLMALGWTPQFTLESGLLECVKYYAPGVIGD